MKKTMRLLLASAALFVTSITSHCLAAGANQVIIPIPAGTVIANGSTLSVTATTPIANAPIYYYSITGTVTATGTANAFVLLTGGTDISLTALFSVTDPNLLPYLQGTVLDASSKFPFTAVNKLAKGHYTIPTGPFKGDTIVGTIRAKAGIKGSGIAYGELTNITYNIKSPLGLIPVPASDNLTFTSGQVVVGVSPITTGSFQPDLSFDTALGLFGVGITGTGNVGPGGSETAEPLTLSRGETEIVPVVLQNSGTASDSIRLSATPPPAGFTEKVILGGKNVAPAVTGTSGYTIPIPFGSGAVQPMIWKITNKNAAKGATFSPVLTATSAGDPTKQDAIEVQAIAK